MNLTTSLTMDLARRGVTPRLSAVRGDGGRCVAISLLEDGHPWPIPADAAVLLRYRRADGTGGEYDTLPDGTGAWQAQGNRLLLTLAPQVLSAPGEILLRVVLLQGGDRLSTFPVLIDVEPGPELTGEPEGSCSITAFLPQPETPAAVGSLLRITRVDSAGRVAALETVTPTRLGIPEREQMQYLLTLLKNISYSRDVTPALEALEQAWGPAKLVLCGISAAYSGEVRLGTTLAQLDGLTVTGHYSDGSSARVADGYSVTGKLELGCNTLTIGYQGKTATVDVTVVEKLRYHVTVSGENFSCDGPETVPEDSSYDAALTPEEGYQISAITVSMGGTDITQSACYTAAGAQRVGISAVTGDVIITVATEPAVVLTGITATYTGREVPAGTSAEQLTGITVTAYYSDGSTQEMSKYAISGTIEDGENMVMIAFGGFHTTITVVGVAGVPAVCDITCHMTNVNINPPFLSIAGCSYFRAVLTPINGATTITAVTVYMGDEDVTQQVYADGIIEIASVHGHLDITATAA